MESYKSPRFWLALAGLIAVSVLAGFRIFSAELAAGLLVGLLSGVGVSTPVNGAALKKAGTTALIALAGIGTALALGGCLPGPDMVHASAYCALIVVIGALAGAVWLLRERLRDAEASAAKWCGKYTGVRDRLAKRLAAGAAVLLLAFAPGCATTGGGKLDPARAMSLACGYHSAAASVAELVCRHLPEGAKRAKCLKYARLSAQFGSVGLGVAGAHLGASCPAD